MQKKNSKSNLTGEKTINQKAALAAMAASYFSGAGMEYALQQLNEDESDVYIPVSDTTGTASASSPDTFDTPIANTSVPVTETTHSSVPFNPSTAPHTSAVNDSMVFSEAFAHARSELGAGGVFTWHGQDYSTFYAEEINEHGHPIVDYQTVSDDNSSLYQDQDNSTEYSGGQHHYSESNYNNQDSDASQGNMEVDIIGIDSDGDGIADAAVVDVNLDASADIVIQDFDHDGILEDEEAVYIHVPDTLVTPEKISDGSVINVDTDGDGIDDSVIIDANHDNVADIMGYDQTLDQTVADADNSSGTVLSEMNNEIVYDGEISTAVPEDVSDAQIDAYIDDVADLEDLFNDEQSWA